LKKSPDQPSLNRLTKVMNPVRNWPWEQFPLVGEEKGRFTGQESRKGAQSQ